MLSNATREMFLNDLSTRSKNAIIQYFRNEGKFRAYSPTAFAAWCNSGDLLSIDPDKFFDQRGVGEATIEEIVDFIGKMKQERLKPVQNSGKVKQHEQNMKVMMHDVASHIDDLIEKSVKLEFDTKDKQTLDWLQGILSHGTYLSEIPKFETNEPMSFIAIDLQIVGKGLGGVTVTKDAGTFYLAIQDGDMVHTALKYVYNEIPSKVTITQPFVWVVEPSMIGAPSVMFSTENTARRFVKQYTDAGQKAEIYKSTSISHISLYDEKLEKAFIRKQNTNG